MTIILVTAARLHTASKALSVNEGILGVREAKRKP